MSQPEGFVSLFAEVPESRFDVRVIDHAIRRGSITRAEVAAHREGLQDDAEHAVESTVKFSSHIAEKSPRRR